MYLRDIHVLLFWTFSSENVLCVQGSVHTRGPLWSTNKFRKLLPVKAKPYVIIRSSLAELLLFVCTTATGTHQAERAWETKHPQFEKKKKSVWWSKTRGWDGAVRFTWSCSHSHSQVTGGHTLKKSASKLHIGFQFVFMRRVYEGICPGSRAHQAHKQERCRLMMINNKLTDGTNMTKIAYSLSALSLFLLCDWLFNQYQSAAKLFVVNINAKLFGAE